MDKIFGRFWWRFWAVAIANLVFFLLLFFLFPDQRNFFFLEGNVVETMTAVIFLGTFFWGLLSFLKRRQKRRGLMFFTGLSLLCFLEELSVAVSVFRLPVPTIQGSKLDSIHDLFYIGFRFFKKLAFTNLSLLIFGGSLLVLLFVYIVIHSLPVLWKYWGSQTSVLVLSFLGLAIIASVIDLGLIQMDYLFALEEIIELNIAVALAFIMASVKSFN
jgi:hypothetical protein